MESTVHTLSSKLDLLMLTVMAQANKDQRSARTRARTLTRRKAVCDAVVMCRGKRLEEESQAAQAEQSNALLDAVHSDALLFD
jgi:hypothetical protein